MRLKITEILDKDIFGQFKAEYLNDNPINVECKGHYGGSIVCSLNKGDICTLNIDAIPSKLEKEPIFSFKIGEISFTEGLIINVDKFVNSIYALNPLRGIVVNAINIMPV